MWSTSALLGRPEYSQSIGTPHPRMGQRVSPCSRAMDLASLATLSQVAVPVREVAMSHRDCLVCDVEGPGVLVFECVGAVAAHIKRAEVGEEYACFGPG